jgi:hypothetical protein
MISTATPHQARPASAFFEAERSSDPHSCQWKGKFMTACSIAVPANIFRTHRKTQGAVKQIVRKTRQVVMAKRIPGVDVDGSEGRI